MHNWKRESLQNHVKNILFDLDGTLADTAPDLATALNQVLQEQGKPPLPLAAIRHTISLGGIAMVSIAFDIQQDAPEFAEIRQRFLARYSDNIAAKTQLFPEMPEVLAYLEMNNIKWGIVTNKSGWLTGPLMQALGLEQRAGCIVSGDSVEHAKPHPAPMLHACEILGCSPAETLFVGDARRDIEAGKNAGMITLVANYGYISADDEPETWGADGSVNSPLEILRWINSC